jgi:Predicted ATPase (AAA+ superfamily)
MLYRGFYPRIYDQGLAPQDWLAGYYQTYVERDVREVSNIGNLEIFQRFVRLCARRTGQLLNLSSPGFKPHRNKMSLRAIYPELCTGL